MPAIGYKKTCAFFPFFASMIVMMHEIKEIETYPPQGPGLGKAPVAAKYS